METKRPFNYFCWVCSLYFLGFGLLLPSVAQAQDSEGDYTYGTRPPTQVKYSLSRSPYGVRYYFQWRDSRGQPYETTFSLNPQDVNKGRGEFKKVGPHDDKEVFKRLQIEAAKIGKRVNAEVVLNEVNGEYSIQVKGPDLSTKSFEYVYQEVEKEQAKVLDKYLREKYYAVETSKDALMIRPDYKSLISRYIPVGRIISDSLRQTGPSEIRGLVSHALEFIQTIPYARNVNDGADFQTPIGLFTDNVGDCDTKAVALASILENFGVDYVMILVPDHLFMGVAVDKLSGDKSFKYKGRSYVLAEPAGIGYPLGSAYPYSLSSFSTPDLEVVSF